MLLTLVEVVVGVVVGEALAAGAGLVTAVCLTGTVMTVVEAGALDAVVGAAVLGVVTGSPRVVIVLWAGGLVEWCDANDVPVSRAATTTAVVATTAMAELRAEPVTICRKPCTWVWRPFIY